MKILELRFKNLNSLYGEWVIDFTEPEYVSNGIFALTGPTGAGKSTILDAICLALYGATPRLGKITRSSNEIMSRQTGECYAEIVFEAQTGRYRCHWEQRRARKKAEGNLQEQEHQIVNDATGKPIETKKSLVSGVIEEKTGMDFDRFTRSILLAQGRFDSFLKADIEQKSKILEQITGTEIYSKISCRVHERLRHEREKLNILNAETSGIVILEPEQEKNIGDELDTKLKQETKFASKSIKTNNAIIWLSNIEELEKEILSLEDEASKLKADTEAFKPERAKLEQSVKAASLDGTYAELTALRKQQADDQASLKTDEAVFPELETSANTQTKALKVAEQFTLKAKENLKAEAPLIQKIRSLDQNIAEQTKSVSKDIETCSKETEKIEDDKQARAEQLIEQSAAEETLKNADLYLKEHAQDEFLISGFAGVEEQLRNLLDKQQEITQKEKIDLKNANNAKAEASTKLKEATKQSSLKKQEFKITTGKLEKANDELSELLGGKLLREYRTEKENLLREMAYIQKLKKLEAHRDNLEDGKPCPLCGSTEHPFARGNIPVSGEIEQKIESLTNLINNSEAQETIIKKLEYAKINAQNYLNDSEKQEQSASNDKNLAENTLAKLKDTLLKLRLGFEQLEIAVLEKLQPLGITQIPKLEVKTLLESLKARLRLWQEQAKQKTKIEKQIASINSEIKRLDAVIETQLKALSEKQKTLKQLQNKLARTAEERKKLYENKKPDDEEYRLNKNIDKAEETEKKARRLHAEQQQKLTKAITHIDDLKKNIEQRTHKLGKTETDFSVALAAAGFENEKLFFDARLNYNEREILASRAKKLDNVWTELKTKQKDLKARLTAKLAKKLTDKTLEELEPQLKEYEEELKKLRDDIAGLNHKITENKAAKEQIKDKQSYIETQKKECCRWGKLHALIGSADGKKYRNFAQILTFESMVAHANRQLGKMTDRYLLLRDEQQPLELNVIDNYQAGEIRSTKNLSGGESFIVSLTLALGLSKMASQKVRVDSLFLDEGFGTLDEEALETALETLAGLHQDGKLIGIISHVTALKERISTQINIIPASGGRSSLDGPGCKKMLENE